jgi:hypothetical protein
MPTVAAYKFDFVEAAPSDDLGIDEDQTAETVCSGTVHF